MIILRKFYNKIGYGEYSASIISYHKGNDTTKYSHIIWVDLWFFIVRVVIKNKNYKPSDKELADMTIKLSKKKKEKKK